MLLISAGPLVSNNAGPRPVLSAPASAVFQTGVQPASFPSNDNRGLYEAGPYKSPLGGTQMDIYRDIFRLQAAGAMTQADMLIARLEDQSLLGHVLAQRYLHPAYKADFASLKAWLDLYSDHPQAPQILKLAQARKPGGSAATLTLATYAPGMIEEMEDGAGAKTYVSRIKRTSVQNAQAQDLIASVRRHIRQGEPSTALRFFNESKAVSYLDTVEKDRVRAMIAAGYLYSGKTEEAEKLAAQALKTGHGAIPLAGWVRGLAQWQMEGYAASAQAFETAASSPYASSWLASAASYWAYRAYEKTGNERRARHALEKAATHSRTFYGILANRSLGRDIDLAWEAPGLTSYQEKAILSTVPGNRAEKLLAAGQVSLAEAELKSLYLKGDAERKKALLAFAYDRRLPNLSIRMAHATTGQDGLANAALYPVMPWVPNQGYRIDRALIHAIIRQESRFNPAAENRGSGATGLMQLMPATANHVAKEKIYHDRKGRVLLKSPDVNLDLGQRYVEELLNNALVGQDLLSLAIAYNAGPGTLARWKAERGEIDDPLLFIETIPYAETRNYVQRVLSNYWIYRLRFNQDDDSADALAQGRWARYAALDKGAVKFAEK